MSSGLDCPIRKIIGLDRIPYISGHCDNNECGGFLWYSRSFETFECEKCGKLFTEEDVPHQSRPQRRATA